MYRSHGRALRALASICLTAVAAACARGDDGERAAGADTTAAAAPTGTGAVACADDNGGLTLPEGFCATVFADAIGGARHMAVAPNGDVFVALQTSPNGVEAGAARSGGILALRDTTRDGRADVQEGFGQVGGTGIALYDGYLYADAQTAVVRYPLAEGALRPTGSTVDTIVRNMPTGGHAARNFVIQDGALYVNFGSQTNSCQRADRKLQSPGVDPCVELEQRAGVWKFDAAQRNQTPTVAQRYATGIRNAVGLAVNGADGQLYATQHGRDQLHANWPKLFTEEQSAEKPSEQLMRLASGDDFGWPYCYFDGELNRLVLAPEYGGNGREVGRCAQKKAPIAHFPAHWAPNALAFYNGTQFPERYRGGAFIAFHGSWNRAPLPQAGYRVTFVPMKGGAATGEPETFASGFAGEDVQPNTAKYRPAGLAVAPDGAMYIADDQGGRIWRVVYRGAARGAAAPSPRAPTVAAR